MEKINKAYIASPIKYKDFNETVANTLKRELGISVFLPVSLGVTAVSMQELQYVGDSCYNQIDSSNIIVVITPFGLSTAAEIGYTINQKKKGENKVIILLQSEYGNVKDEAAIHPYVDYFTQSLEELIEIIRSLVVPPNPALS